MPTIMRIAGFVLSTILLSSCDAGSSGSSVQSATAASSPTDARDGIVERLANLWMLKVFSAADKIGREDLVARLLAHQELSPSLIGAWYITGSLGTAGAWSASQSVVANAQMDDKVCFGERFKLENSLREAALNDAFFSARLDVRLQLLKHHQATATGPAVISTNLGKILVGAETLWNGLLTPQLAEEFVNTEAGCSKRMTDNLARGLFAAEQTYIGGVTDSVATAIAGTAAILEVASTEQLRGSRQRVRGTLRQVLADDAALMESLRAGDALAVKHQTDELLASRRSVVAKLVSAAKAHK